MLIRSAHWRNRTSHSRNRPARFSIRDDAGGLDLLRPFLDLALDESTQVLRRAPLRSDDVDADLLEACHHCGRRDGRDRGVVEHLHDRRRSVLREEKREPIVGVEAGQALLIRGGEVGQCRRSVFGQDRDRLDGLAFDIADGARGIEAMVVDPTRDQVLDRCAAAAIRDVRDFETCLGIEERAYCILSALAFP